MAQWQTGRLGEAAGDPWVNSTRGQLDAMIYPESVRQDIEVSVRRQRGTTRHNGK